MQLTETSKTVLTSLMAAVALSACGGGGGDDNTSPPPPAPGPAPVASYAVSGEVSGLGSGKSVVLQNNGSDALTRSNNGAFEFASKVETGKPYNVTVATQPQWQTCAVTNGSGTASATVSDIKVQCTDDPVSTDTSEACFSSMRSYTVGSAWTYVTPAGRNGFESTGEAMFEGIKAIRLRQTHDGNFNRAKFIHFSEGVHYYDGTLTGSGDIHIPTVHQLVFTPGVATPVVIPLNRPYTNRLTKTAKANGLVLSTSAVVLTITYQGRETVPTAFGTFETCKMQYSAQENDGPTTVNTDWVIASGKLTGLVAQSQANGKTTQPLNIEVNWQ